MESGIDGGSILRVGRSHSGHAIKWLSSRLSRGFREPIARQSRLDAFQKTAGHMDIHSALDAGTGPGTLARPRSGSDHEIIGRMARNR
jgi:hypothetical protein